MEDTEKSTIPPYQKELTLSIGSETTFFRHPVNTKVAAYHLKYDYFQRQGLEKRMHLLAFIFYLPQAKGLRAKEKLEQSTILKAIKGPTLGTYDPL